MATAFLLDDTPMGTSYRRAGAKSDCYRIWIEGAVLRIDALGDWNIAAAQAYTADITRIVEELRQRRPHLRAIVDRSDVPTFEPGVPEILMTTYETVLRAGDRVALVVDSSLAKAHIRQKAGREETQSFLSISAAKTWVMAYG